ncbi:MAG: SDR family oxidoreductase [Phycisphaerales bacterium]|nr:SDR family oxidoreductase [Phycisphaerales bacterium]
MTPRDDQSTHAALVTGASGGIGAATARRLAATGRPVVLLGRRRDELDAVTSGITDAGGVARAVCGDVTEEDAVTRAVDATQELGGLQILVANAGIMPLAPLEESDLSTWKQTVDVNLSGMLHFVHAALPLMQQQKRGDIVLISSVAGRQTFPEAAVYCATKAAMNHFADCLRVDLAKRASKGGGHLRVGVVQPGIVKTDLLESIPHDEMRTAVRAFVDSVEEPLHPEDIAEAVAWMVDAPSHVSINDLVIRPTAMTR